LGKTTLEEIMQRFGSPTGEWTSTQHGPTVKEIGYGHGGVLMGVPLVDDVRPERAMRFYFADRVLVGYYFESSYQADHTDFDETLAVKIKQGETTEAEVTGLLGRPSGRAIWPRSRMREGYELLYHYEQNRLGRLHRKSLFVHFDDRGIVKAVNLLQEGKR
jgi:hypothetical protein